MRVACSKQPLPLLALLGLLFAGAVLGKGGPAQSATEPESLLLAARESIAAGELQQALVQANKARALDAQDSRTAMLVGEIEARLGRTEAALEALDAAIALAPSEPSPYLLSALLLRDADRLPEAIAVLQKAPADPAGLELLALLHLSNGDSEKALVTAEKGLGLTPSLDLKFARAMALAAIPGRDSEAKEALELILDSAQASDLSSTKRGQAHLELADLLGRSEEHEAAEQHFSRAAQLLPREKEVPFRYASYLRQQGRLEDARAALEHYQELDRAQAGALEEAKDSERRLLEALREAQARANQNQLAAAITVLETVPLSQQNDARWRLLRAKLLFSMNRADEALADLEIAARSDPDNLETPYVEAIVARSLGRLEEAESSLRGLVALAPEMGDAYYLLAVVLADQGKLAESVESYERALALGIDTPALRTGLDAVRKQLALEEN